LSHRSSLLPVGVRCSAVVFVWFNFALLEFHPHTFLLILPSFFCSPTNKDGNTGLHLALQTAAGYGTCVPRLVRGGASVTTPNHANLTPLHLACSLLAVDVLAVMAARVPDMAVLFDSLLSELMHWCNGGSYGSRQMQCVDVLLASLGHSHNKEFTEKVKGLYIFQRSALMDDHTWRGDTVLPLQVLARRVVRKTLAHCWIRSSPTISLDTFLAQRASMLPVAAALQHYIIMKLPSPTYTPGSSFRRTLGLGNVGVEFRLKNGMCMHYNDPRTCTYGSCGTTADADVVQNPS
jgi:hypothetical protein